jgi:hypothetical protein
MSEFDPSWPPSPQEYALERRRERLQQQQRVNWWRVAAVALAIGLWILAIGWWLAR